MGASTLWSDHHHAIPPEHEADPAITEPAALARHITHAGPDLGIVRLGLTPHCLRIDADQPAGAGPSKRWSLDFLAGTFGVSRRFRIHAVIDDYTRECLALAEDTSLRTREVGTGLHSHPQAPFLGPVSAHHARPRGENVQTALVCAEGALTYEARDELRGRPCRVVGAHNAYPLESGASDEAGST